MSRSTGRGRGVSAPTAIEHQAQLTIAACLQIEEVVTAAGQEWGDIWPVVKELAELRHLARDAITANQAIIGLIQQAPERVQPSGASETTNG